MERPEWVKHGGRICWAEFEAALKIARDVAGHYEFRTAVEGIEVPGRGWYWHVAVPGRTSRVH